MATEIIIPKMGVNMTEAILSRWLKQEGELVNKGEPVVMIETDKAIFEIEAEDAGNLLKQVVREGETVPVMKVIGYIGTPGEKLLENKKIETKTGDGGEIKTETKTKASPAARRLAKENSLSLETISPTGPKGEVTVEDVENALTSIKVSWAGKLSDAFINSLKGDIQRFAALGSEDKIKQYKNNGAEIGAGVVIGKGSYIIAEYLEIGDGTKIGDNCVISCRKIKLGEMNFIGRNSEISCKELLIGDVLYAVGDFLIGGGGEQEPNARLWIGNNCFLGKGVVLNPCEEIILEDEVCLSPWAKVFTHSHWQSALDGYNADFAPVRIKKGAWLGPASFVMPGVTIGAGATVTGNSFVALDVPPRSLAGGVPAKVIKSSDHYPKRLTPEQKDALLKGIIVELVLKLKDKGYGVEEKIFSDRLALTVRRSGVEAKIVYSSALDAEIVRQVMEGTNRLIIIGFYLDLKGLDGTELSVFDLTARSATGRRDELSDEVREHLRKRGIRFTPILWRYMEGLK
ncbi:E3 binding domain-containing protein [Candidatus Saganbacteria bacterium]|nr:E3 binding domain-containing protein [Candidatus Gottesmanbacteria bacterium]MBI5701736.1 E3 binding domain-containing protein [Candidatus Saganbacteria bacterium]